MVLITAYIRPHRLETVKSALALLPISGLTTTDARGSGNNPEEPVAFFGQEILVTLPVKSKIEVACSEGLKDQVVEAIVSAAHTGQPGDGKLFIEKLCTAVRIRTGERNDEVV